MFLYLSIYLIMKRYENIKSTIGYNCNIMIAFVSATTAQVVNPKEVLKEKATGKLNEKIEEVSILL